MNPDYKQKPGLGWSIIDTSELVKPGATMMKQLMKVSDHRNVVFGTPSPHLSLT